MDRAILQIKLLTK